MAQAAGFAIPPSDEEADLYYYGLPSCPRLIARSSACTKPWVNPQRPEPTTFVGTLNMYPRILKPVGRHLLLHELWNNASSLLRAQVLQAVSAISWTSLDILRVGLNGEYTITLMIAVVPETLSWNDGYPVTLQCKRIFEAHGIHGMECEIRESVVNFCTDTGLESTADIEETWAIDAALCTTGAASSPGATATELPVRNKELSVDIAENTDKPAAFQLSSDAKFECHYFANHLAEMSDCLGTKIGPKEIKKKAGTKGLYLSLKPSSPMDQPKLLALTCRHVVIDDKIEGIEKYDSRESEKSKDVIQIDQPALEDIIKELEQEAESCQKSAKAYAKNEESAATFKTMMKDAVSLQQRMATFKSPSSRVFGHLYFSPKFTFITDPARGTQWLRDWALVELSPKSHQASLNVIKNKVYVGTGQKGFSELCGKMKRGLEGLQIPIHPSIVDRCIILEKTAVPMNEILNPPDVSKYFDNPMMAVAIYGGRSGLTLGLGSTLVSLLRHIDTPGETTPNETSQKETSQKETSQKETSQKKNPQNFSEEWPIVPAEKANWSPQAAFSREGDSGSCIWDMFSRPAGILTAGVSKNGLNDVTYAQPLARLLKDIESCGFDVSLV